MSISKPIGVIFLVCLFAAFSVAQTSRSCCIEDTVLTNCFRTCTERTCANLLNPTTNCSSTCVPDTCVCRDGLYRNKCNQCVTPDKCQDDCEQEPATLRCTGQFEMMYPCLDPVQARVCPELRISKPLDVFFVMKQAQNPLCRLNTCDCIDGYLRNKCGVCVPANKCGCKSCVDKHTPCSGPNEVRVKNYRKCTARTCENLKHPLKCKRKAGKVRKNVCDCIKGYRRNNCGRCVPEHQCHRLDPCLCTDPCVPNQYGLKWQCINSCYIRNCRNYYEIKVFKNVTCPSECVYGCSCDESQDLWFNGKTCVPSSQCPPYADVISEFRQRLPRTNNDFFGSIGSFEARVNDVNDQSEPATTQPPQIITTQSTTVRPTQPPNVIVNNNNNNNNTNINL